MSANLKYWKRFALTHLEAIQAKALKFALALPNIASGRVWIGLDMKAFRRAVPELTIALAKHQVSAPYAAIIAVTNPDGMTKHVDAVGPGVMARLNIPLLNCEGSITEFYTYPHEPILVHTIGGVPYMELEYPDQCVKVDEVELNQPTLLRVSEPHRVVNVSNKLPRLALSIQLSPDPVRWLT
jgi:hypothetical protein